MPPLDFWKDQALLTDVVQRPLETSLEGSPSLGAQIAPLRPTRARAVKVRVGEIQSFGLGQFKAPDAIPALFKARTSWREEMIEMALLEEMERISSEHYIRLQSPDDKIRAAAGLDLVTRGRILQLRNERLTEWMRWQSFSGSLLIRYPDQNSELLVDYGLPTGHKPTSATAWTDLTNADPLADMTAWQELVAADSGEYGIRVHMNSNTWKKVSQNAKVKAQFTPVGGVAPFVVRATDVQELLREGTSFTFYDKGYRAESAGINRGPTAHTRFLPDGKVLITTDYVVDGQRIADMPDGEVEVSTGFDDTDIRLGAQSELILHHMSKNRFYRQASARIPRLLHPENFLYATAY